MLCMYYYYNFCYLSLLQATLKTELPFVLVTCYACSGNKQLTQFIQSLSHRRQNPTRE